MVEVVDPGVVPRDLAFRDVDAVLAFEVAESLVLGEEGSVPSEKAKPLAVTSLASRT